MNDEAKNVVTFSPYLGLRTWIDHAIMFAALHYVSYYGPNNEQANARLMDVSFRQYTNKPYGTMNCTMHDKSASKLLHSFGDTEMYLKCMPSFDFGANMQATQVEGYPEYPSLDTRDFASHDRDVPFAFVVSGADLVAAYHWLRERTRVAMDASRMEFQRAERTVYSKGDNIISLTLGRMLARQAELLATDQNRCAALGAEFVMSNACGKLILTAGYSSVRECVEIDVPGAWREALRKNAVNGRFHPSFHCFDVAVDGFDDLVLSTRHANALIMDEAGVVTNRIIMQDQGLELQYQGAEIVRIRVAR